MALCCAAECALSLACARWAARRLSISGGDDSASWPAASPASFAPVPRACRDALAAYDAGDQPAPPLCPPYRLVHDRDRGEVVLAVRGLGLARPEDYRLLLDAGGPEPFAGGHAHRGLLRAAVRLLDREGPALRRMVAEAGRPGRCRLVFVGHSLGAGVAALAAVVAVRCWLGRLGLRREDVRCYAMAPPRCMSLGLAVEYADVVHSVVLQDDFLPRTPAPLQHIFGSIFCLPCLLCFVCMRDTFVSEGKLKDPAKLYAPGTVFHIVERKNCRCGRFPPEVRTAVPTVGRFEHVVLSCNAAADHGIIWIEKEAQKALDLMEQEEESTSPPAQQKMLRAQEVQSFDAEDGAIGLHSIEHLVYLEEAMQGNSSSSSLDFDSPRTSTTAHSTSSSTRSELSEWDELVEAFLGDHEHMTMTARINARSTYQFLTLHIVVAIRIQISKLSHKLPVLRPKATQPSNPRNLASRAGGRRRRHGEARQRVRLREPPRRPHLREQGPVGDARAAPRQGGAQRDGRRPGARKPPLRPQAVRHGPAPPLPRLNGEAVKHKALPLTGCLGKVRAVAVGEEKEEEEEHNAPAVVEEKMVPEARGWRPCTTLFMGKLAFLQSMSRGATQLGSARHVTSWPSECARACGNPVLLFQLHKRGNRAALRGMRHQFAVLRHGGACSSTTLLRFPAKYTVSSLESHEPPWRILDKV